jgi:beta-glucosidase-like glycosyl hydrolase
MQRPRHTLAAAAAAALGAASLAAARTVPANTVTYDTRACQPPFDALPFCDTTLSLDERVDDLIARVWQTNASVIPWLLTARNDGRSALPLLGVPEYDYGLNCIHGVQSSCVLLSDNVTLVCPTSFPNPVNYGSAWNKSLAYEMGRVVGLEARALWLLGAVEEVPKIHIGLDCWSPNINIARDPRWGRNQEVASEDPLLNGDFGSQYTQGLQRPRDQDSSHLLVAVTLKHWDAYSLENSDGFTRNDFNAVVSNFALQSTYFPAFRQAVQEGGSTGVMCSYNAVNGIPTCASPMLTTVLRDTWGFTGYVTSDSGALENIAGTHHYTNSSLASVPVALRDGQCDVCSGGIYSGFLMQAYDAGLVSREDIDLALKHTFKLRFEMGLFDPPSAESNPYWLVPASAINTPEAQALNLLTTQESMVLLKHDGATLPLARGKTIAIIGPHANATTDMTGNYLGQLCPDDGFGCIVSPFLALQAANVGGTTAFSLGCGINGTDRSGFAAAIALAQAADIVVLALGIDDSIEAEAHDRVSIDLPQIQHDLAAAVVAAVKPGTPVAAFLLHGGCIDISAELANPGIGAILDAGYPGLLGGAVIADTLLGANDHLGGKLATTWYPASYTAAINMSEMELDVGVGRGYRFYAGPTVLPFGFGLALTTFEVQPLGGFGGGDASAPARLRAEAAPSLLLSYALNVTNTGGVAGDEVVMLFFEPLTTPMQPRSRLIRQLSDYRRVHLLPGESQTVTFGVSSRSLRLVDRATGNLVSSPGDYDLVLTNGVTEIARQRVVVEGKEIVVERFPVAA